ncbi:hypothetical protein ACQZV8_10635 [Magnetococcales bacterium HHB-1]
MYELGLAYAMGKQTLLVTRSLHEIPVDLKSKHIILYKDQESLEIMLREEFLKTQKHQLSLIQEGRNMPFPRKESDLLLRMN